MLFKVKGFSVLRFHPAGAAAGFLFACVGTSVGACVSICVIICLVAPASSAATAPRTCDASALPDCAALASAPLDARGQLGFGTPRDGGAIFNGQAYWNAVDSKDEKVRKAVVDAQAKLMTNSPAHETRAKKIADETRKKAIDFIKMRLPESPERALLIERLTAVKIETFPQPPDLCGIESVPAGFPNLGYSSHTNTLSICTPATNITERQLVRMLAHEFGHVISPCMAQTKQYTLDKDQLFPGPLVECSKDFFYDDDGNRVGPEETIQQLLDYQPDRIVSRELNPTLEKLLGCGIIKEIPNSSVPSSEAFAETKSCLLKKFEPSLERSPAFKLARTSGKTPTQAAAQLHASGDDVCAADVEEAFADSFSASLLGQIALERNWSEKDLQVATLDQTAFNCYEESHGRAQMLQYELASMRIKALLNDPETAKRLRCEIPKDANLCPMKFSSARGSVKQLERTPERTNNDKAAK
jgi:hypothetical protein